MKMAVPKNRRYLQWKVDLISLIVNDTKIDDGIKREEIKCVCRDEDSYIDSYLDGDSPEEAWQAEIDAMVESQ
jgi:hypothetical protein